jgi:hypothetical protein
MTNEDLMRQQEIIDVSIDWYYKVSMDETEILKDAERLADILKTAFNDTRFLTQIKPKALLRKGSITGKTTPTIKAQFGLSLIGSIKDETRVWIRHEIHRDMCLQLDNAEKIPIYPAIIF